MVAERNNARSNEKLEKFKNKNSCYTAVFIFADSSFVTAFKFVSGCQI